MKLFTHAISTLAVAGAVLVFSASPAQAQARHPAKPLLWKIEGPGLEKASYLFGTMHIGDEKVTTLHPAAEKAFEESEVVHTEAAFDMASQMAAMPVMMRGDGKKLDEVIGAELSKRLNAELKTINAELDSTPFQTMKTWMVAYSLPFLPEQIQGIKALDMVLWERAEKDGKKTAGMQETKDQVAGFNALTEEEQTRFLSSTLDFLEKDRRAGRDRMKEAAEVYASGDLAKVNELANEWMVELTGGKEAELSKKLMGSILKDRDVIMADYVESTLKKAPKSVHFFAAGAAHYTGRDSVPALLEKKGYKVTRIEE
jgi:uncharacterized protein YbaP (TraB family)